MACHDKHYCCKLKTHKSLHCHKKSWIATKICHMLLPNHMEDRIVINHKGQQYFQLVANK
jgi:hypothetical protein